MYKVDVGKKAKKFLSKLNAADQEMIVKRLRGLESNPRPYGHKKLQGHKGLYRVRTGDYRIIYAIKDKQLLVLVVQIGHRREIYREK